MMRAWSPLIRTGAPPPACAESTSASRLSTVTSESAPWPGRGLIISLALRVASMLRILLVDDHAILRQGLRAILESRGMSVVGEVTDGHDAVRQARALLPDVALVDIAMPRLNGIDVTRALAHATPSVRV